MAKRLGLLHELLPGATRFAVLVNPNNPSTESVITDLQAAALTIGRQIEVLTASSNREMDTAFASALQKRVDALLVSPDPLFGVRRGPILTPVMRPTKFEFVINLHTAKLLGIEVPPTLLALADEVIE